ncbi:MAG: imidazole glycerol phosphate synthase subunit HisH [Labilithrix sp.]|nr:imidazole glycerol phosphate synthase subunit HisH [Labilithrix sp.]
MRVVVCDPGVANVRSVVRAAVRASAGASSSPHVSVSRDPAEVRAADVVIVPGQGSFGAFARAIDGGLGDALRELIARGRPYLGICLGMQVLFESSEEAPGERGLGVYPGVVRRLRPGVDPSTGAAHALPHIGWNTVDEATGSSRYFYFAHSYAVAPADASLVTATTSYGDDRFASMIAEGAVLGVQFHPEKSQDEGLALLRSFFSRALGRS